MILWYSMDWFKGKFTGTPQIAWEKPWCPVDFPLSQFINVERERFGCPFFDFHELISSRVDITLRSTNSLQCHLLHGERIRAPGDHSHPTEVNTLSPVMGW